MSRSRAQQHKVSIPLVLRQANVNMSPLQLNRYTTLVLGALTIQLAASVLGAKQAIEQQQQPTNLISMVVPIAHPSDQHQHEQQRWQQQQQEFNDASVANKIQPSQQAAASLNNTAHELKQVTDAADHMAPPPPQRLGEKPNPVDTFDLVRDAEPPRPAAHLESNELQLRDIMINRSSESMPSAKSADDSGSALELSSIVSRFQAHSVKSRRHGQLNLPLADWWTKLPPSRQTSTQAPRYSEPSAASRAAFADGTTADKDRDRQKPRLEHGKHSTISTNNGATKTGFTFSGMMDSPPPPPPPTKRTVYKEQPLDQNAILTIRNQLSAIRGKHRVLVTRSMQQLQQLDNRLIESYRLCLKKKMPLYAGMLYRTRDFVTRMAREVNHERRVLEAMTKQVQSVLRQKMTNRTLVREYNRLVAPASSSADAASDLLALQLQQPQALGGGYSDDQPQAGSQSQQVKLIGSQSVQQGAIDEPIPDHQLSQDSNSEPNELNNRSSSKREKLSWFLGGKRGAPSKEDNQLSKATAQPNSTTVEPRDQQEREQEPEYNRAPVTKPIAAAAAAKQIKYTVSVNEVNLRKELTKIQSLIDRINGSCYELTAVVDDIIYLFKLNGSIPDRKSSQSSSGKQPHGKLDKFHGQSTDSQQGAPPVGQPSLNSDPKQVRKMLRSPIKVFLERYGRLANLESVPVNEFNGTSSNSDLATMNLTEIKPLFEPSSLIFSEFRDPEIGFD